MSIKDKVKSYSFWVSLASALVLILQVIGSKLGFYVDARLASDIITSACSILVITGIIVTPTAKQNVEIEPETSSKENTEAEPETISPENSFKENMSILADNLKDVADKILDENKASNAETNIQETLQEHDNVVVDNEAVVENKNNIETDAEICNETDLVAEPIEPTPNDTTEPSPTKNTDETTDRADNLKTVLSLQKEKYADNIDEYYQILLSEIKSLRAHE